MLDERRFRLVDVFFFGVRHSHRDALTLPELCDLWRFAADGA